MVQAAELSGGRVVGVDGDVTIFTLGLCKGPLVATLKASRWDMSSVLPGCGRANIGGDNSTSFEGTLLPDQIPQPQLSNLNSPTSTLQLQLSNLSSTTSTLQLQHGYPHISTLLLQYGCASTPRLSAPKCNLPGYSAVANKGSTGTGS